MIAPPNHGKLWTSEDKEYLVRLYLEGKPVGGLCAFFGRTRVSIECKLAEAFPGFDIPNNCTNEMRHYFGTLNKLPSPTRTPTPPPSHTKEKQMKIVITDKKLVNGVDVKDMSEDDMFKLIAQAEAEVKRLGAVEHKPKALQRRIDDLESGVVALVALCDDLFT